jgi:lysyl-tRNA synthetase class 2
MNTGHFEIFPFIQKIQHFFASEGFLQVWTPPIVENPGMETHIHPVEIQANNIHGYLHTSPEFAMKEMLSHGLGDIFNIGYCFRDEPSSQTHRAQFLMLEWYRVQASYETIKSDCKNLIQHLSPNIEIEQKSVQELFDDVLRIDILNYLDSESLRALILENFKDIHLDEDQSLYAWEDYYFLLFLNKIEPRLESYPALIIDQFPAPLSALSNLNENDQRVCKRFELYLGGLEIANCFDELTDLKIQKQRFINQTADKKKLYGYELPEPTSFYQSLERGLPKSAGIALGIERLFMALNKKENPFWS